MADAYISADYIYPLFALASYIVCNQRTKLFTDFVR